MDHRGFNIELHGAGHAVVARRRTNINFDICKTREEELSLVRILNKHSTEEQNGAGNFTRRTSSYLVICNMIELPVFEF